jgi:hypothetical protein
VINLDRRDAHLILAAIRVLAHRHQRPPRPDEVAELLDWPEATVRLLASRLQELGVAILVESAFATHLEIRDYLEVEKLPEAREEALAEDLADFDRRKQAEAEKMARLFDDGTFQKERQAKLERMDAALRDRPRKPRNPFEDAD